MDSPIIFTDAALTQIQRYMQSPGFDTSKFLRVGIKGGGGCGGFSYLLGFDDKQEADKIYQYDGFEYIMLPAHGMYVTGLKIDWQEGEEGSGFTFITPSPAH